MLIDTRKPNCHVLKWATSTSGKYRLFYGIHYPGGKTCFDCGTVNDWTGEIVTRHYESKAEALRIFHEYERELTKPIQTEEQDENNAYVADAFRRALEGR